MNQQTPSSKQYMTRETLEARAIQRARDLHTHVIAVPGRPGVYTVTSSEDKGKKYNLVARDGIIGCSCSGFFYRRSCRHIAALEARLARESRRPSGLKAVA